MSFDVRLPGEAQDIVADSRRQWCSGARNLPALRELRILLRENYSRITLLSLAIGIERPHYRVSLTSLSLRGPGYVVGNFGSRAEAEIDRFVQLKQVMSDG